MSVTQIHVSVVFIVLHSNAIQVKNIAHAQVGHIPRDIASKLAPLLDRKMITVEGVMLQGNSKLCYKYIGYPLTSFLVTGFSYALSVYVH